MKETNKPPANLAVLGANIKRLLHHREMTQEQLATAADLTRTSVSAIVNGGNVKLDSLQRIADALKVDLCVLLTPLPDDPVTGTLKPHTEYSPDLRAAIMVVMAELMKGGV
jgi:transcriptional regulator with XRE-family HTH domain